MTEEIQKTKTAGKSRPKRRAKRKRGRPSIYSDALATEICYRIASGKSLRAVCEAWNIPNRSTVLRWLASRPDFAEQYGRAMEARAYVLLDEVLEIADDSARDYKKIRGGKSVLDFEHIQRARLRVAARQWFFSGLRARKYGDRGRRETPGGGSGPGEVTIRWANSEAEGTPDPSFALPPSLFELPPSRCALRRTGRRTSPPSPRLPPSLLELRRTRRRTSRATPDKPAEKHAPLRD